MTELEGVIRYHESLLTNAKVLYNVSAISLEETTIKYLKELKAIKDKEEAGE